MQTSFWRHNKSLSFFLGLLLVALVLSIPQASHAAKSYQKYSTKKLYKLKTYHKNTMAELGKDYKRLKKRFEKYGTKIVNLRNKNKKLSYQYTSRSKRKIRSNHKKIQKLNIKYYSAKGKMNLKGKQYARQKTYVASINSELNRRTKRSGLSKFSSLFKKKGKRVKSKIFFNNKSIKNMLKKNRSAPGMYAASLGNHLNRQKVMVVGGILFALGLLIYLKRVFAH